MSKIGKVPVKIPAGVKVELKDGLIKVEGKLGKLSQKVPRGIEVKVEKDQILVAQTTLVPNSGALQGMFRTLTYNLVNGVSTGFTKELDIVGVGYRAAMKGQVLTMTLGFSHPVEYTLPAGVTGRVDTNTHIVLSGADKVLIGMVAAKVRSFRPPEPYQGKGVKYTNEVIIRKEGKAAGAK